MFSDRTNTNFGQNYPVIKSAFIFALYAILEKSRQLQLSLVKRASQKLTKQLKQFHGAICTNILHLVSWVQTKGGNLPTWR